MRFVLLLRGQKLIWLTALVLAAAAASTIQATALPGGPKGTDGAVTRMALSFDSALDDEDITELLRTHGVRGEAAYMWVSGFTGTHRLYEPALTALFATGQLPISARQASIKQFRSALEGNVLRLDTFTTTHSADDVANSPELTTSLRSLLDIRYRLGLAIAAAEEGGPIVYGIEISGSEEQVKRASRDSRVHGSREVAHQSGKRAQQPTKPAAFENEIRSPELAAMDGRTLHSQARAIVQEAG